MSDSAISFAVLAGLVALFLWNRLPVEVVAVGASLVLCAADVIEVDQALAGFGDNTVIFIASLFVVSEGLDASGVTTWAGRGLIQNAGDSRSRLLAMTMLLVAALTALISVNGAVAALLPVVVVMAVRLGRPPSQLLLPLAFGAHAGSMLALTGTPVNVIVSDAAREAGSDRFAFFEFTLVGLPLLAGTVLVVVLFGERLLPHRSGRVIPPDFGEHARVLADQYELEGDEYMQAKLFSREMGVAEVVIPPRSGMIGTQVFPGMVSESGDLVILAVHRRDENMGPGQIELVAGDVLLLEGTWGALDETIHDPDVLLVHSPDLVRRQTVPLGRGSKQAIVVLGGMVVLLATDWVPPAVTGLLAASAMIVLGVVSVDRAYRSISWSTVLLVAGMIPLSTAMQQSGAAGDLADALVALVGDAGPHALLVGLFVLTAVFGQLISNTATALIVTPIAVTAAADMGVSVRPVLMCITVAAAAAFLTPVATPVNLMVMGPGGYRFGDYWKLGLPLLLLFFVVATLYVPLVWSF